VKKYKEEEIVIVCFVEENVVLTKKDKIITRFGNEDMFEVGKDKASDFISDTIESFTAVQDEAMNTA